MVASHQFSIARFFVRSFVRPSAWKGKMAYNDELIESVECNLALARSREGENRIRAVRGRSCPCWQLLRLTRRVRIIVIYCLAASRRAAPLFSNQPTRIDKLCESQHTVRGSTIHDPSSSNRFVQHRERLSSLFLLFFFRSFALLRLYAFTFSFERTLNERLTNVNTNLRTRKYTVLIAYNGTRAQRFILFG